MEKMISRRNFFKLAGTLTAAGAVAGLAGCSSSSSSASASASASAAKTYTEAEMVAVRVGYWGGTCESPLYVAFEKDLFTKYGIKAEMVKITSGSSAFLAEGGNCIFEATPNFLPMMINGLDVKFIAAAHTGCLQAVASATSGITSIKDLEGKKVGLFSAAGDPGEVFLKAAMTDEGLDYTKTEWIVEGNIGTILKDLTAGNIDAFAYFDPYGEIAADFFGCTKFWSNGAGSQYEKTTCCFYAANKDVYENADVAKRVASAVDEAAKWIQSNQTDAAALVQDKAYVAESSALLQNFGVDAEKAKSMDIHETLLKTYTFGDSGKDAFDASLKAQWEIIEKAGMLPEGKTIDELCAATGAYAL